MPVGVDVVDAEDRNAALIGVAPAGARGGEGVAACPATGQKYQLHGQVVRRID